MHALPANLDGTRFWLEWIDETGRTTKIEEVTAFALEARSRREGWVREVTEPPTV